MIEGWWPTHNVNLAACLGALGMPVRTDIVFDERSGEEITTFYLGLQSLWNALHTDQLIQQWQSGELERADPLHAFLCGLRSSHNAVMLESSLRNGRHLRLAATAGNHATIYVEGDELPSLREADELIETNDAALVAALGVIGIPVIEHERGSFRLPRFGHSVLASNGEWVRHDAQALTQQLRDGSLERDDPQHPLISAYNARCVHAQITTHLHSTARRVLLRKPRSIRSAFVAEDASDDMLDRVQRHFRIP
ncbi:hypothetical protein [Prosthecobacter sp.]